MSIQGFRGNCDSQASWGCAPALPNRIQVIFLRQAAGEQKVFRCSSFSKMLPRRGRAAHICEANQTLQVKLQQKSKRESEESQLPSKSGGCNKRTRFQGQLRFPGKLGMCPSLAEPDSRDIPRSEVSNCKPQANKKFFGAAVFQKCCRGVDEQPTFAKQIRLAICFSCCNCIF